MGCAQSVFATEIDVKLFEEAERGRGYGVAQARARAARLLRVQRRAGPRAPGRDSIACNRRFADFPDTGPGAVRAFDLRQGLDAA